MAGGLPLAAMPSVSGLTSWDEAADPDPGAGEFCVSVLISVCLSLFLLLLRVDSSSFSSSAPSGGSDISEESVSMAAVSSIAEACSRFSSDSA